MVKKDLEWIVNKLGVSQYENNLKTKQRGNQRRDTITDEQGHTVQGYHTVEGVSMDIDISFELQFYMKFGLKFLITPFTMSVSPSIIVDTSGLTASTTTNTTTTISGTTIEEVPSEHTHSANSISTSTTTINGNNVPANITPGVTPSTGALPNDLRLTIDGIDITDEIIAVGYDWINDYGYWPSRDGVYDLKLIAELLYQTKTEQEFDTIFKSGFKEIKLTSSASAGFDARLIKYIKHSHVDTGGLFKQ